VKIDLIILKNNIFEKYINSRCIRIEVIKYVKNVKWTISNFKMMDNVKISRVNS